MATRGEEAERDVEQRIRAALPAEYRVYPNVRWTAPTQPGGPAIDGEADLVIAHPDLGLLVLEVKAGEPRRDTSRRWWLGPNRLDRSPFEQARDNKYALVRKLTALPDWPADRQPRAGHAVAFPSVDLDSLPAGHSLLGPDAPHEIVLDATALETPEATGGWVDRCFDYWIGDGRKGDALGAGGIGLLDDLLAPTVELRRLISSHIREDQPALVQADRQQLQILNMSRAMRRVEVIGPAGSGKSMLAAEKARRTAREGYRTLLVCFNQRLASELMRELVDSPAPAGLEVSTFHRLCERFADRAGITQSRPLPIPQKWWDETLPGVLEQAMDLRPADRYHAVIVDEGQDFEPAWLLLLQLLLVEPDRDVLWVFHDPGQALFRPDRVAELDLERLELFDNHRNPSPVAQLAARFYRGPQESVTWREGGLGARIITAEPGPATIEALRVELHRLTYDEGVAPYRIAVLSGVTANKSEVWRHRRFGNITLWNEAFEDDGSSKGLAPEDVPDEPPDALLFETIRRFKGLERDVVILVELPSEGERLDELLYVALTRATTSLTVIAPPKLVKRLS